MVRTTLFCWIAVLSIFPTVIFAQLGGIRGHIMDRDFEVPLPAVKVRISETGQEVSCGDAGSFFLENIQPGSYTLLFSKSGYGRVTQPNVVVAAGQLVEVEVALAGEYEEMDELVVRDIKMGGSSELGLLNLRMESSGLMDAVGADLMSKAGASDAAQALTLVPGTTVQDGKYAVVRGLPDRYVSTQMNGVRLPTADPDKRAVQLDQFPASMIESMQVKKTFTPDQQGDASGGAVNVILKGIPQKRILRASVGYELNTQVLDAENHFLTYLGGGIDSTGNDAERIEPQANNTVWEGAVGVSRGEAPQSFKLGITAGDRIEFDSGYKVGAFASFFYKTDASYSENGVDDRYWQLGAGQLLTPAYSGNANLDGSSFDTKLFDVTKASEELQWGALGAWGIEKNDQSVSMLYSYTFSAEDKAILLENTRGKYYFFPGHNPYDQNTEGHFDDPVNDEDNTQGSRFRRNETLEYTERVAETLQFRGNHILPFRDVGLGTAIQLLNPEVDWTVARSSSSMDRPDQRLFESFWVPPYERRGRSRGNVHETVNNGSSSDLNLFRVWRKVDEESWQYFVNGKLPFEQWTGNEGSVSVGYFSDRVRRRYRQDSYAGEDGYASSAGDWNEFWSTRYPTEGKIVEAADVDADYDGRQDLRAFYYTVDVPLNDYLRFIGGARFEKTRIDTTITDADGGNLLLFIPPSYTGTDFEGNERFADSHIAQDDILPSLNVELTPFDKWVLRGSYSETVARMTFKELTPLQQQEYLGGDIFIGNPFLEMSALKNYDVRLDYNPYPGGLFSFSWFYKEIENPIEYRRQLLDGAILATTAENYPDGMMNGYEAEVRQSLGLFSDALEGLSLGGNFTYIESEVTVSDMERENTPLWARRKSRQMLNAPEFLYNLNATYTVPTFGTELGLFYTVKGDTLLTAGGNDNGFFSPDVFAKERGQLNLTLSQKLGNHFKLSFKMKNITDSKVQQVYRSEFVPGGDVVRKSYKKGIDYSVGVSGTW